jgi:hypothetical protein
MVVVEEYWLLKKSPQIISIKAVTFHALNLFKNDVKCAVFHQGESQCIFNLLQGKFKTS